MRGGREEDRIDDRTDKQEWKRNMAEERESDKL
jgi:hypothetical protein